jgi:hypothetical protein
MDPRRKDSGAVWAFDEEKPKESGRPLETPKSPIDVPAWVKEHLGHISITEKKERNGMTLYVLSECPFNPQHKAPDAVIGQYPTGAVFFKCFHDSCKNHDWQTLKKRFGSKSDSSEYKKTESHKEKPKVAKTLSETNVLPVITLGDGQLRDVTEEVIEAIRIAGKTEPLLYVRGDRLARIIVDSDGHLKPSFVGAEAIPEIMSRAADFIRIRNKKTLDSVGVFPPENLAKAIVNRGRWSFPKLKGIVEIPVLREDGTILDKPGYDPASQLYYHPSGPIPKIPDAPAKEDSNSAADFLIDILSDFPFQDEASRDNALGLLLTVVV